MRDDELSTLQPPSIETINYQAFTSLSQDLSSPPLSLLEKKIEKEDMEVAKARNNNSSNNNNNSNNNNSENSKNENKLSRVNSDIGNKDLWAQVCFIHGFIFISHSFS